MKSQNGSQIFLALKQARRVEVNKILSLVLLARVHRIHHNHRVLQVVVVYRRYGPHGEARRYRLIQLHLLPQDFLDQ
jgi:hypothetical protein